MSNISFELVPLDTKYHSIFAVESIRAMPLLAEIPCSYISHIEVKYQNGMSSTLRGDELENPFPINAEGFKEVFDVVNKEIKHIKVFLNVQSLEKDVDKKVSAIFGKSFSPK